MVDRFGRRSSLPGFLGGLENPPRDLLVLVAILFTTYCLWFFDATRVVPGLLSLTQRAWKAGFLWQILTNPLVGTLMSPLFFLLELLFLFLFARPVYERIGRKRFFSLLAWATWGGAVVAVAVQVLAFLAGLPVNPQPFSIIQGQHLLFTVVIAGFATLYADATVLFMFIIPMRARWFLGLEVLFGFMAFLTTKDFAGFIGLCAAVAISYSFLTPGVMRKRLLRELWLRFERRRIERKLARIGRRKGIRVVRDDDPGSRGDPWVH
jgi:hypothetical protein